MPKKQPETDQSPENASEQQSSGYSPMAKRLAITFGLAQLIWLAWLGWVAWKVLSA